MLFAEFNLHLCKNKFMNKNKKLNKSKNMDYRVTDKNENINMIKLEIYKEVNFSDYYNTQARKYK